MTYREIALGLHHENNTLDLHRISLDSTTDTYCYDFNSPITIPAPSMRDLDYFPHHILVLGSKCIGCLRSRTDPTCGCGPGYDCTHPLCTTPITQLFTPRGPTSVSRSRSPTNIHATSALAPVSLCDHAGFAEGGILIPVTPVSVRAEPVYASSEVAPGPRIEFSQSSRHSIATPGPVRTPSIACQVRLPPISALPPLQTYGADPEIMSAAKLAAKQTRYVVRGSGVGISGDALDYGTAGMALPPAKLTRKRVYDKLPPIPSTSFLSQTTFPDTQRLPLARRSGGYAPIWVHRLRASLLLYHLALFARPSPICRCAELLIDPGHLTPTPVPTAGRSGLNYYLILLTTPTSNTENGASRVANDKHGKH
ncbi:hypothetical protein FRC12_022994 [Ceratobasidium sp. 428]|nr:hypothetical protein FRC12_022994 [Ceratobasidium sp. 428]